MPIISYPHTFNTFDSDPFCSYPKRVLSIRNLNGFFRLNNTLEQFKECLLEQRTNGLSTNRIIK